MSGHCDVGLRIASPIRDICRRYPRLPAREYATNGSQKEVCPTANPINPGTPAAVRNHSTTFCALEPRPRMMHPTSSRPSHRAASASFRQSSRRSHPSIFQTSGSTPAFEPLLSLPPSARAAARGRKGSGRLRSGPSAHGCRDQQFEHDIAIVPVTIVAKFF
jgi:hypothetical protein